MKESGARIWLVIVGVLATSPASAQRGQHPPPLPASRRPLLVAEEVFKATVAGVYDGDSIVVRDGMASISIRLDGVDAPELSQPLGPEARAALSGLIVRGVVTLRLKSGARSDGERLARIEAGGRDVSLEMIRRGMAWHCRRQAVDRTLADAEQQARRAKRGLWSASTPVPPWQHRGDVACWQD
jgi:endonuclease YncB( thermonuclease family)